MPSIPLPTNQTVFSEGALPYERVNATPEDFGAQTGRAISGMGQTLGQVGDQTAQTTLMVQQYKNEQASMSALNTFQTQASDLMNGNADKGVTGFNTLLGKDAVQQQGTYQQQLQSAFDNARGQLNPAAQRSFDQMGRWALRGAIDRMGAHAAQQQIVYDHTEARASVSLNQQAALNGADDPNTWANALAATQEASLRGSRILGLDDQAAEAQRKSDLSKIFVDRTQQLMLRDPISAQKFYRDNIGMVDPNVRYSLERALNETTNTQYAATDGATAAANALGRAPAGALPQNFNAPIVKPYSDQQISDIVAAVKKPSEYDDIFKKVGAQYNIDPTELKMRAVAESGLNPSAVSSQGAVGIAQITPDTAKSLGIDPKDPQQSIEGMARLMVRAESGAAPGDKGAIDRAYYGGSPTAQGPNTDQYVANLSAVRGRLYGGSGGAPLTADEIMSKASDVEAQARAIAEQRRPGDAVYADRVVAEAQRNWNRQLQQVRSQDYSNMTQVLDAAVKGGIQSAGELPAALQQTYAQLPARDQLSVQQVFRDNIRQASGEYTPSDPKVFNDTLSRITLPVGDPNRITDPTQITPLIAHGLNYADSQRLITQMRELNSPETNPFLRSVNQVKQTAQRMLSANLAVVAHPEVGQEAAYRFGFALDSQIAAMKKAGKDPHMLFDPTSPDYVLKPERVMSFLPSNPGAAGNAPRTGTTPNPFGVAPRQPGESPEAYLARTGVN